VLTITDQQGRVLAIWIKWTEVVEFFDSDANSRHYRLDRHTGEIEFGDGVHGRIPPAESRQFATHCTTAGFGSVRNAPMMVSGNPTPVMPQLPMRPSRISASNAGMT